MAKRFRRKKTSWGLLPYLGLVFILIINVIFLYKSEFLLIKEVDIALGGISCVSKQELNDNLIVLGQNFFLLNQQSIERAIKEKFICIKNVNLVKKFPHRVTIEIFERQKVADLIVLRLADDKLLAEVSKPEGSIEFDASDSAKVSLTPQFGIPQGEERVYKVDLEGMIFSQSLGNGLLKIYYYSSDINVGSQIGNNLIHKLLTIKDKLKEMGIEMAEVSVYKEIILINTNPKFIFSQDKEIDSQLAALQLIISQAKMGEEKIEFIDLRFDKPIVRYGKR